MGGVSTLLHHPDLASASLASICSHVHTFSPPLSRAKAEQGGRDGGPIAFRLVSLVSKHIQKGFFAELKWDKGKKQTKFVLEVKVQNSVKADSNFPAT